MELELTREERKAIFAGDYTALKRQREPDVAIGDELVLAWSRGGKQFLDRSEEDRQKNEGRMVEIERKPTVWIQFTGKKLKDGKWVIEFQGHDAREHVRTLAGPPSPPREAGLKTRWGQTVGVDGQVREKRVPKRGEETQSHTPESERGYGGGGKGTVDEREGVDDATLHEFATEAHQRFAKHREEIAAEEETKRQARAARSELDETLRGIGSPAARSAFLAEFQRMCQKAKIGEAA